jgi:monovalent cation:H+ antiporter-2, CPA2 family
LEGSNVIRELVIILLVSIPIVFLFKKVNLPSIVGFLIAGVVIGPHGYRLITEIENIERMAEIGVILLLFTIGVEVSIQRLIQMRKVILLSGTLQIILTVIFSAGLFYLLGIPLRQSIFFGMLLSLSSTAVMLSILSENREIDSPHGKIVLGILVFQDLAIVPMILFVPILGADSDMNLLSIILHTLGSFAALGVILLLARYLIPKIIYQLATSRIREAFTIGTILLILGTAYMTEAAGLSLAIGAFLAGLIVSESEFSHQIFSDIIPLKDAFNSIFFVSIGLLLNLRIIVDFPLYIGLAILGIIMLKGSIVYLIIIMQNFPLRTALVTGLCLAQIGEFSFVLAQIGMNYNLIQNTYYNAFLAVSISTMLVSPFLVYIGPVLAARFGAIQDALPFKPRSGETVPKDHVIIAGYGLNGRNLARVLRETGIPYVIVELNPETVTRCLEKGERVIYGDISRSEILLQAGVKEANVIVFALSDIKATRIGVKIANIMNPLIHTIARTLHTKEIEDLLMLGANEVIPEEFETSLQIFGKVLEQYHIPLNVIMRQMAILRRESYQIMRKEGIGAGTLAHLDEILAAAVTERYFVEDDNPNLGKTFAGLNLRAETGATVIAVIRNGKTITTPSPHEKIHVHDTYVLVGDHNSVDRAIQRLNGIPVA